MTKRRLNHEHEHQPEKFSLPPESLAFVHIPRTGGTSFRQRLLDTVGNEHTIHWSRQDGFVPFGGKELISRLRSNPFSYEMKNLILGLPGGKQLYLALRERIGGKSKKEKSPRPLELSEPSLIIGHFDAIEIRKHKPDIALMSIIRDPFDRAKSEYKYLQENPHEGYEDLGITSFEDFIRHPNFQNVQARQLGFFNNLTFADYSHIGITQNIDALADAIGLNAENKKIREKIYNRSHQISENLDTPHLRQLFNQLNAVDLLVYKQVQDMQ